jgi:hypothetical protein
MWPDLVLKSGRRGGKPSTNRHDQTFKFALLVVNIQSLDRKHKWFVVLVCNMSRWGSGWFMFKDVVNIYQTIRRHLTYNRNHRSQSRENLRSKKMILLHSPITVAALSKAWTAFARVNGGIVGSNPTRGMDVYVRLFCLCCSVCR